MPELYIQNNKRQKVDKIPKKKLLENLEIRGFFGIFAFDFGSINP